MPGARLLLISVLLAANSAAAGNSDARVLPMDRLFEVLPAAEDEIQLRACFRTAAEGLTANTGVDIAGVFVEREMLLQLAKTPFDRSLTKEAREIMQRPVDVFDLAFLLDDILASDIHREETLTFTPGRARSLGLLVHPSEVFRGKESRYGDVAAIILRPPSGRTITPAADGDILGPDWHGRFANPEGESRLLMELANVRPKSDFAYRIMSLMEQLRHQDTQVVLESAARPRERGYLMYGAYWLSKAKSRWQLKRRVRSLNKMKRRSKLKVPIRWNHPQGWRDTRRAAQEMADTYGVVFATRSGALKSRHYDGEAIDMVAVGLPEQLILHAPDGVSRTFDLGAPAETRDLNLSPALIEWIEAHFGLRIAFRLSPLERRAALNP